MAANTQEGLSPFDFSNAICETKEAILEDETTIRAYSPFFVNRHLSYFPDTVLYANEMNVRPGADKFLQYMYLFYSIRQRRRRTKWHKREKDENLELVSDALSLNWRKARVALQLLTEDQLAELRRRKLRGGVNGKERV